MEKIKVTFYPDNKTIEVEKGKTILFAAISAGVHINSVCGGDGVCGRCKVVVKSGKVITRPDGAISQEEKIQNMYLSCLTTVHSDVEIEIPTGSRMDFEKLTPGEIESRLKGLYSEFEEIEPGSAPKEEVFAHSPLTAKCYLELPRPNLNDRVSDLERLQRAVSQQQCPAVGLATMTAGSIKMLSALLRDADWKVTVTLGAKENTTEIAIIEPGDTSGKNFGFAFDIGTTTISGQLIDLNTKKIRGTKAAYNKQATFGSDVITRIIYACEEDGLQQLHKAVSDTINQIIQELLQEHGIDINYVTSVLCAGNTTMIHLLLRIDPKFIRREPYVPTANFIPVLRAEEAGVTINHEGLLSCVPGVSSYVGGDTTAGVLSSGLYRERDLCVLIDIGTNGEIVLGNSDFLVACAASAGPAFEGSGVTCGMRSSVGAIQKVKIDSNLENVTLGVIGNARPRGICGSGYIDIIAEMLKAGIIDKSGKIISGNSKRIHNGQVGREFVIAFKEEADTNRDIVITEADIENLKRSKAAIYSATAILIKHMDLDFSKINKFFIAGGFGTYIDIENAVRIGLLPDLKRSKFVFIGNSALAGARQMLLSLEARKKADEIARKITYFELSVDPGFMDEYMAALFFPHTDLSKFPSVRN
jgi:uncharacterized 2Fe-2S/4Fe-4S cluster protein (DUF4445 family)